MRTCPNGHETEADDYCDTCGIAMPAADEPIRDDGPEPRVEPEREPGGLACPNCGTVGPPDALFCENCGYDHTTGTMPRSSAAPEPAASSAGANPAPTLEPGWMAEVWIDPDWYSEQESSEPLPSPGLPAVITLRNTSLLVGRSSRSRNISPDINCGADTGVSRRHAQLTTDGSRWWVEDLGSSNGTYVGAAVGALPKESIRPGDKREVAPDERIYVGAWTRIVIRRATEGEGSSSAS